MCDTRRQQDVRLPGFLGFLAVLAAAASAAPVSAAAVVSFVPLHGVISGPADTLTVQIVVDSGASDLRGLTYVFEFDPTVAVPVGVTAGALLSGAGCPHFFTWLNQASVGDSIAVDAAGLGCSVSGPGSIASVRFVGVQPGLSPLDCRRGEMRDSFNMSIPQSCQGGTILYVGPTPPLSGSWGRLKSVYR